MARNTKLTEEVKNKIIMVIKAGNYIETSAIYAGVTKKTLYNWINRGNDEIERLEKSPQAKPKLSEKIYVEFTEDIEVAIAESEIRDLALIGRAAEVKWEAAGWRLERRFPEKFGKRDRVQAEITGKDGGPIEVENPKEKLLEKLNELVIRNAEKIGEVETAEKQGD